MHPSFIFAALICCAVVFAAVENPLSGIPTSVNGNIGLVGGGYGDVYGGKIKEGVYGAGGRVGGNLNLVGTAGLGGRQRRQTVTGSGASAGAIASGPDSFSMAGAAAGSGSINFGGWMPGIPSVPATTTPAPAPAATTKPCNGGKRRRRSTY